MNHWIRPSCDSRTGASHLRRGAPCQDASGFAGFRDAAGTPIQVLVVSDGHGGSRYVRSQVGARLACAVAMRELEHALAPARVDHPGSLEEWRGWLAEELPGRIVTGWRREVERHWHADGPADATAFSTLSYGATLGVLLLTPLWWAHTGLGDWDLVRIDEAAGESLLSEEPGLEGPAEATCSLCMVRPEAHFAPRTALYPLSAGDPPFALLLCSDGLRKSCGSDTDFLTLARYLTGLDSAGAQAGSAELAEALDHISSHGSGDDVSVAVARWVPLAQAPAWPQPDERLPAWLVQPQLAAAAGPGLDPLLTPLAAGRSEPMPLLAATGEPAAAPMAAQPIQASASRRERPSVRRRVTGTRLLLVLLGVLGLGGAGLLIAAGLGFGPLAGRPQPPLLALTPQQRRDLQRQVGALCTKAPGLGAEQASPPSSMVPSGSADGRPALQRSRPAGQPPATAEPGVASVRVDSALQQQIITTLAARAIVFRQLQDGDPERLAAALRHSSVDPLSALIAYSATDASLRSPVAPTEQAPRSAAQASRLAAWLPSRLLSPPRDAAAPLPLAALGICPELRRALGDIWQGRHGDATVLPAGLGRVPAHPPRAGARRPVAGAGAPSP